jgi:hypothetical protein
VLLVFDPVRHRYIGERLTVTPQTFDAATAELIRLGMHEHDARAGLRDEARWSSRLPGVERIRDWPRCSRCGRPLWPARARTCEPSCAPSFDAGTRTSERWHAKGNATVTSPEVAAV